MRQPDIHAAQPVIPMIYAYTTPEIARHQGWTKIGYTEQKVETRIKQQTHTMDALWHLEWKGNALFDDGSGTRFTDKAFHAYLRKNGIEQGKNNEWFHITGPESHRQFQDFRANRGILKTLPAVIPYRLRQEQADAVAQTLAYSRSHPDGAFLWNAKPRFGKTLSVYDFCKQSGAQTVLIVTNRPAIANSWYDDYRKFLGPQSGYLFVSEVDALRGKDGVLSRDEYTNRLVMNEEETAPNCIEFVSLQDMKGSKWFGGTIDKLKEVADMHWDVLVIDEAHEGVDTYKTDVAFEQVHRNFTLHLSGTPFKALAGEKFSDDAIYNWTYADEQKAKRDWDASSEQENPYADMPQLNLFTYQMSEIVRDELQKGKEIDGETAEYAFDLNEFFRVANGKFVYDSSVDKFLDALTLQEKYPFSTPELRAELKHTFWLLDRVDSAKALAKKLQNHPVFKDYDIIVAAGDGQIDDKNNREDASAQGKKAYDRVKKAIHDYDKTITLSVGQLTTGVTIPEWTGVLMLSNIQSPAQYIQATFRAQNPCLFRTDTGYARKKNAYVFDFDPARTLTIFEEFANALSVHTAAGRGDVETRKDQVRELLNFFPVIGEDDQGELVALDAEKVLTIPRKIRSVEVVRRGFMSNFLFQNISQIFGAPQEVLDIIQGFEAVDEPKQQRSLSDRLKDSPNLNEDGEVDVPEEVVIGRTRDVFGDKVFAPNPEILDEIVQKQNTPTQAESARDKLKKQMHEELTKPMVEEAQSTYGPEKMTRSDARQIQSKLNHAADQFVDRSLTAFTITKNRIDQERREALQHRHETGRTTADIEQEFAKKADEAVQQFQQTFQTNMQAMIEDQKKEVVQTVETNTREREKSSIEEGIRDHLRGFSRTIPAFLMAYGDEQVTLATFDQIVPEEVFQEVTSITLEQFRFLRDGGDYEDDKTGKTEHFAGNLFDPVVFDDSVKEFLRRKKKLANYFDETQDEDIFDYIPPQKTNQIFTPKAVVRHMVDLLEQENPGCFDDPSKTFMDLYMKSGLFIAEIVKRLYRSPAMQQQYPDAQDRLRYIFAHQVYGLAPTAIIYAIATSYILGFADDGNTITHNFRHLDALPYAKEGTLSEKLDDVYGMKHK